MSLSKIPWFRASTTRTDPQKYAQDKVGLRNEWPGSVIAGRALGRPTRRAPSAAVTSIVFSYEHQTLSLQDRDWSLESPRTDIWRTPDTHPAPYQPQMDALRLTDSQSAYSAGHPMRRLNHAHNLSQRHSGFCQIMDIDAKQCTGQSCRGATGIHIAAWSRSILGGVSQRCCRSGGYGCPRASRNNRTVIASPAQNDTNDTVGMRSPAPSSSTGCRHPQQGLPGV